MNVSMIFVGNALLKLHVLYTGPKIIRHCPCISVWAPLAAGPPVSRPKARSSLGPLAPLGISCINFFVTIVTRATEAARPSDVSRFFKCGQRGPRSIPRDFLRSLVYNELRKERGEK